MSTGDRYYVIRNSDPDMPHYLTIGETVTEQPAHDLDDEYRLVQNRCGVQQYVLLADLEPIPEGNPS